MKKKVLVLIITILIFLTGTVLYLLKGTSLKNYTNMLQNDINKASLGDRNQYNNGEFKLLNKETLQEICNMIKKSTVQDNDINKAKELQIQHINLPSLELTMYHIYNDDIGIKSEKGKEVLITLRDKDRERLQEILNNIARDYFIKTLDERSSSSQEEDKYYEGSYIISKSEGIQLIKSVVKNSKEVLQLEKVGIGYSEQEIIIGGKEMYLIKGNEYYLAKDLVFIKIKEEDFNKITDYLNEIEK